VAERHPIGLVVRDDLRRSRVTVAFRLLLAVPHLVILLVFGLAAIVAAILNLLATLARGSSPARLHGFLADLLAYATRVHAYLLLLADPYPSLPGGRDYPVELRVSPPAPQRRWTVLLRPVLALPAAVLASVFAYLAGVLAVLGWFVCLARGRFPQGMRDLGAYCLRYVLQTQGYLLLLTPIYPSLDGPPGLELVPDQSGFVAQT